VHQDVVKLIIKQEVTDLLMIMHFR